MEIQKKFARVDNYILQRKLGQGANAKVKLALNQADQVLYAMKIFKVNNNFEQVRENLLKEVNVMLKLNHERLINLKEIKQDAEYVKKNGQTYKILAIVIEFASNGELFDYLEQGGAFPQTFARTYFQQLLEGLNYLHSQGYAHRDLKPENLLFDDQMNLRIADFGFTASLMGRDGTGNMKTVLGTEGYMAPEIIQRQPYNGVLVDIFAAGVILFIMITGHPPFGKADSKVCPYFKCLATGKEQKFWDAHKRNKPEGTFTPELIHLFNRLFSSDPQNRPSMAELKNDPWVNGPLSPIAEIRKDFIQRQQLIMAKLEAQRLENELKRKNQRNTATQGVGKFRGEIHEKYKELVNQFPNIWQERQVKHFDGALNPYDLVSYEDIDEVLCKLLNSQLYEENEGNEEKKGRKFAQKCSLDEDKYIITFEIQKDEDNFIEQTKFNIELLQGQQQNVLLQVNILEGTNFSIQQKIPIIRQILLEDQ